jgi:hypothetical protein
MEPPRWKMAASLKEKTRRPVFVKERAMTGTETRPVSMCAAACTHRRLHPPINDTNAAALTTSGSTARQAALEGSGVLGVPPLAMLMLAGSLDHCQTGSSSTFEV